MKKILKPFSIIFCAIALLLMLASCQGNSFYSKWHARGAEIEKENCYQEITLDEAKEKKTNKETFAFFLGILTDDDTAVSDMTKVQFLADNTNFEGKVYFVTVKRVTKSIAKDVSDTFKLDIYNKGLFGIAIKDGIVKINTSNSKDDTNERFMTSGSTIDIVAVAEYFFTTEGYHIEAK